MDQAIVTSAIRLVGLPTDSHSSYLRGAAQAPAAIRAALWSDHANSASECGLELGSDILVDDAGDLSLDQNAGDFELIRAAAEAAASAEDVTPIFLGGDHMVTYPIVAGLARVHGPVNILHFDAHPDLYDDFDGDPLSHASPFARIMEQNLATRLVQVGVRTLNKHCREQVRRFGVEVVEMRDFAPDRVPSRIRRSTSASTWTHSTRLSRRASRTTSPVGSASATSCRYFTACVRPSSAPMWSNITRCATSTA
jgi:arginase